MNIRLRIATPQDAQLIHDTYGHYVLTSTATFNEVNSSVEARAEEIRSQLELYPWLIAEDETGRYLGYACAEAFRPQTGYRYFAELTIFLAPDAPRRSGIGRRLYQALLPCLARQRIPAGRRCYHLHQRGQPGPAPFLRVYRSRAPCT